MIGYIDVEFSGRQCLRDSNNHVLGYYEPGHYCLVVIDGRAMGGSSGANMQALASLMSDLGCREAYNLDGGNSAEMVMPRPDLDPVFYCKGDNAAKVRPQSDIIYFATAVPEEERK